MSEVVIYPARQVRTMDPARPAAEAVAVRGDRVRAVGSLDELTAYGDTRIDDRYAEQVLFPGLVEAHTHLMSGAAWNQTYVGYYERRDPQGRRWPGCRSIAEVIDRLSEIETGLSPEEPLMAWGLDPLFLPGERLNRHHLDAISATRPVVILHQSCHLMTLNSAALRANGITRDTTVEGVVKESDGEPNGELQEPVAMELVQSVPKFDVNTFEPDAAWNFAADARNHGATTLTDLGSLVLMDDDMVSSYRTVVDDGAYPARISAFHLGGPGEVVGPQVAAKRLRELRSTNSAKLRFGHVKLVLDGSIQGFTARLLEPGYLPDGYTGAWLIPPETFAATFRVFHEAGLTVHVHTNGDETTELLLDTVEHALEVHPRWDHRHTATHSQLSTAAQYRRMAALGMCANIFSNHIYYLGDQHRDLILGPDRASRMDAAATAIRSGVPISMHCDTPVTPLDPLATASYAAERRTATGKVLGEHERISVREALHAMTLGSAYMLKMDHEVGSIEAGKYADFAVLDEDPWDAEPAALREINVLGTVVGGNHFPTDTP